MDNEGTSGKPVLIAAYGRAIAVTLEQCGADVAGVFERANVPLTTTTDPMRRMSNFEVSALFRESCEATGDAYFGLSVADCFPIGNLHALGFALLVSSTLRDFCLRLSNYYHLLSHNVEIRLVETSGEAILAVKLLHPDICSETEDAFAAMMVRLIRMVSDPHFAPECVELVREQPEEGGEPYKKYFQSEVLFGQKEIRIYLKASSLDTPLPGGSKELAQMHDRTAMEYLAKLERQDIASRARAVIVDILSSGLVSKQGVADRLHMSTRNLELKLAREQTNFQKILDDTRQSLAEGYIEQSSLAITEIAYLLGFSDAANFTRAFRRWVGKSPLEYRKSLGLKN